MNQQSQPNKDTVLRLFIDPGSKSCGWALFRGSNFEKAGTFKIDKRWEAFKRLGNLVEQISAWYCTNKAGEIAEVHIETLNYQTHFVTIHSVGVIGATFSCFNIPTIEQDIPIKSWQKFAEWDKIQDWWAEDRPQVWLWDSEDAWAAYWMGRYWLNVKGVK